MKSKINTILQGHDVPSSCPRHMFLDMEFKPQNREYPLGLNITPLSFHEETFISLWRKEIPLPSVKVHELLFRPFPNNSQRHRRRHFIEKSTHPAQIQQSLCISEFRHLRLRAECVVLVWV